MLLDRTPDNEGFISVKHLEQFISKQSTEDLQRMFNRLCNKEEVGKILLLVDRKGNGQASLEALTEFGMHPQWQKRMVMDDAKGRKAKLYPITHQTLQKFFQDFSTDEITKYCNSMIKVRLFNIWTELDTSKSGKLTRKEIRSRTSDSFVEEFVFMIDDEDEPFTFESFQGAVFNQMFHRRSDASKTPPARFLHTRQDTAGSLGLYSPGASFADESKPSPLSSMKSSIKNNKKRLVSPKERLMSRASISRMGTISVQKERVKTLSETYAKLLSDRAKRLQDQMKSEINSLEAKMARVRKSISYLNTEKTHVQKTGRTRMSSLPSRGKSGGGHKLDKGNVSPRRGKRAVVVPIVPLAPGAKPNQPSGE